MAPRAHRAAHPSSQAMSTRPAEPACRGTTFPTCISRRMACRGLLDRNADPKRPLAHEETRRLAGDLTKFLQRGRHRPQPVDTATCRCRPVRHPSADAVAVTIPVEEALRHQVRHQALHRRGGKASRQYAIRSTTGRAWSARRRRGCRVILLSTSSGLIPGDSRLARAGPTSASSSSGSLSSVGVRHDATILATGGRAAVSRAPAPSA